MIQPPSPQYLPIIMGALCQQSLDGELVLEQNDGVRRLYWREGELVYLKSEAAGEQFGNFLLRQGILDFPALNKVLASEERFRLGEKVVRWGLMTVDERDNMLQLLQRQVMINALEHPIIQLAWNPGPLTLKLSEDLHLQLEHRHFIWNTFAEAQYLQKAFEDLASHPTWEWEGIPSLLDTLSDLPLNPVSAYALSFLGSEPVNFATFVSLSGLSDEDAARMILSIWAVGGLKLVRGDCPFLAGAAPPEPEVQVEVEVEVAAADEPEPPAKTPTELRIELDRPLTKPTPNPEPVPEPEPEPTPQYELPSFEPEPILGPVSRARSLYRTAKFYRYQERTAEAIRCLEQAVQLDPHSEASYPVWLLLGKLRMANPAWSTRTINALQAAARVRPKAAEPWVVMGEVYFRKNFQTNALSCFQKALELDPSIPLPQGVDLKALQQEITTQPTQPKSFFERFKSMLGGSGRE